MTLFVLGGAYGIEVFIHRTTAEEHALLSEAARASTTAGCSPVRVTQPYPRGLDRAHVGRIPALSTYPSVPPASGPHDPVPLGAGVYPTPPPIARAIHSLEHAATIVWFDPAAGSPPEVRRIEAFFARSGERNHVIVAPYNYPGSGVAGRLPAGTQMALVGWHHLQTCARPSLAAAYAFVHAYRFDLWQPWAYRGTAPEKFGPI